MTGSIPRRLPSRFIDEFIHITTPFFVPQIQLLVDVDGRLDPARLAGALRLCLDAEPVLGCRYVPRWIRPYWERLSAQALDGAELLREEHTGGDDRSTALERFLVEPLSGTDGPQLRALLVHDEAGDQLVLKVSLDGEALEEIPLLSLSELSLGDIGGSWEYTPPQGWEGGTYTFQAELYVGGKLYTTSLPEELEITAPTAVTVPFNLPLMVVLGGITGAVLIIIAVRLVRRRRASGA